MRPTKLVDFEGIARYHNVNIMLYVPKKDGGKDAVSLWQDSAQKQLVHKKHVIIGRPLSLRYEMDVLCKRWECKGCKQTFTRNEDLTVHLKEERCTGGKTKIICSGGKFKHILKSSEKVFYGGKTKFSYSACQWIEAQAMETGKHIHHKNVRTWCRTHGEGLGFK